MKRYIYLTIAFIFLVIFLFININNWQKAVSYKENLQSLVTQTYDLKTKNQDIKLLIATQKNKLNYDLFTKTTENFTKETNIFLYKIKDIKNTDINSIVKTIKEKADKTTYLYEDFKSLNAVINNSIIWLKEVKREELCKDKKDINYKLIIFLSNTILDYYEKVPNKHQYKHHNQLINKHIIVIDNYYTNMLELNKMFSKYDLDADLSKLIYDLKKEVVIKEKIVYKLMIILLITALLLFLLGSFLYIKEIQARHKADKLKHEMEQFFDALNESAIVSKTDLLGNITYVNDKFCKIANYTREELIGKPHSIIRHPKTSNELFKKLWNTIENKKVFKAIIKNKTKDGITYYVDSVVIPLLNIDGEIIEYMSVRYDVTALVYAKNRAIEAQKAKDEFLSNMSHELRTPLNAIIGFSHILQKSFKGKKEYEYIDNIHQSSKHLLTLINEILDLSKIQSGKFILSPYSFNIQNELTPLLSQFKIQTEKGNITYQVKINSSTDVFVEGDWIRIAQIINNLLSNAIKFTPQNGTVEFTAKYENNIFYISVKDTGIGMSQEVQNKIFQPFVQADSSTTRNYGGTGLGLSITHELIEAMQGKLDLISEEKVGTKLTVTIPLSKTVSKNDIIEEIEEFKKLQGNILVAEDNMTNQLLIQALLEEFDLECDIAKDGEVAIEMFKKKSYDIILMDENMPKLTGTQAMKIIKQKYNSKIPIIALTANNMVGAQEEFLKEGMDGFISKPINNSKLYNILDKYLKRKE
jgi:PAS domain S-box-containing protein